MVLAIKIPGDIKTFLSESSKKGYAEGIQYFITLKPKVVLRSRSQHGQTVAHIAASWNNAILIRYLVNQDRNVLWVEDDHGNRIIHTAAANGALKVVKYLVELNSTTLSSRNVDGDTPLHVATRNDHPPVVKYLVEECPEECRLKPQLRNFHDETSAHLAAKNTHCGLLKYFMEHDISLLNALDSKLNTVLHRVLMAKDHLDAVVYLVRVLGADINISNSDGNYPIHLATENGDLDAIKFFVSTANTTVYQNKGIWPYHSVVHVAAKANRLNVLKYFIEELHMDADSRNTYEQTPFLLAAGMNYLPIVKYLISKKADPYATDIQDKNVLFYVARNCTIDLSVMKYLYDEEKFLIYTEDRNGIIATASGCANGKAFLNYYIDDKMINSDAPGWEIWREFHEFKNRRRDKRGANLSREDGFGRMQPTVMAPSDTVEEYLTRRDGVVASPYKAGMPAEYQPLVASSGASPTGPFVGVNSDNVNHSLFLADVFIRRGKGTRYRSNFGKVPSSPQKYLQSKIDPVAIEAFDDDRFNE